MKWKIDTSTLPAYVRVENEGSLTLAAFTFMWSALLASDFWQPGLCVLFDNRNIEPIHYDGSDARVLSDALDFFEGRMTEIGSSRIALLMGGPEDSIFAQQCQLAVSLRNLPASVQMFFGESDALAWLSSNQDPPRSE
jgi:hypothetical protein